MAISEQQKGEIKLDNLVANYLEKQLTFVAFLVLFFLIIFSLKSWLIVQLNGPETLPNLYNYSASKVLSGLIIYDDKEFEFNSKEGIRVTYQIHEFYKIEADFEEALSRPFIHLFIALITSIILSIFATLKVNKLLKQWSKKSLFHEERVKAFLRGGKLVEEQALKEYLEHQQLNNSICIGNLPTIKNEETVHAGIMGDIGTGKSQTIMNYLDEIKQRKEKTFVFDKTGEFVTHYYNPETDIILSPFDQRSENWTPFCEGTSYEALEKMATCFCPKGSENNLNKHWDNASNMVFKELLYGIAQDMLKPNTNQAILETIIESTKELITDELDIDRIVIRSKLQELVQGTLAQLVISEDSPKHASDVISTLVPKIQSLQYLLGLERKKTFSIKDWVNDPDQKGTVFIRVGDSHLSQCKDLVTAWIATLVTSATNRPAYPKERVWLVIDELQGLGKIDRLDTAIEEGRKYNIACVLGFTSQASLEPIYGPKKVKGMLSSLKTKVCFGTQDPETAQYLSNLFGDEEVIEGRSSLSQGRNSNLGEQEDKRTNKLVLPTQIQFLEKFHCYVRLPNSLPVTKVKTWYKPRDKVAEYWIPRNPPPPPKANPPKVIDKRKKKDKTKVAKKEYL